MLNFPWLGACRGLMQGSFADSSHAPFAVPDFADECLTLLAGPRLKGGSTTHLGAEEERGRIQLDLDPARLVGVTVLACANSGVEHHSMFKAYPAVRTVRSRASVPEFLQSR
jgi:hypothetical protein